MTEELVQKILQPGLEPGAADIFLEFICYSGGPLPEELLPQVTVSFRKLKLNMLITIPADQMLLSTINLFFIFTLFSSFSVSSFDSMGWQGSVGAHWAWKSLWEFWYSRRLYCLPWCGSLPSGFFLSLSCQYLGAVIRCFSYVEEKNYSVSLLIYLWSSYIMQPLSRGLRMLKTRRRL